MASLRLKSPHHAETQQGIPFFIRIPDYIEFSTLKNDSSHCILITQKAKSVSNLSHRDYYTVFFIQRFTEEKVNNWRGREEGLKSSPATPWLTCPACCITSHNAFVYIRFHRPLLLFLCSTHMLSNVHISLVLWPNDSIYHRLPASVQVQSAEWFRNILPIWSRR